MDISGESHLIGGGASLSDAGADRPPRAVRRSPPAPHADKVFEQGKEIHHSQKDEESENDEVLHGIAVCLAPVFPLPPRTSLLCFALVFGFNVWFVPAIGIPDGYMGSAWAALASYFIVMVVSYFLGKKYYPLPSGSGRCSAPATTPR